MFMIRAGNTGKRRHCVASPVELLQHYREQQETCTLCVASPVELLQLHMEQQETKTLCSISFGATVALQGKVGNAHTVQHLVQSYCSSTGNSGKRRRCVASPVELLQLYREQQEMCTLCSISCKATVALEGILYSISCGATVALQGIVGNVHAVQHLLWSYCSSTKNSRKRANYVGNSRKHAHCVAFPRELYTKQQELHTLCNISCGINIVLQGIVGIIYTIQNYLLNYCSSTGNNWNRVHCIAFFVELL